MIRSVEARAEEARNKARDLFARDRAREDEVVKEREKVFSAETQKTARLKALRLARDAEQRAAAEAAPPTRKPGKKPVTAKAEG
jgi:hypothetical protein